MAKIDLRACYSTGPVEVALVLEMLRSAYESLPMDSARLDLAIRVQPRLLHALRQFIGRRLHIDTRCLQATVSQQRCQADEVAWMVFEVARREGVPERVRRRVGRRQSSLCAAVNQRLDRLADRKAAERSTLLTLPERLCSRASRPCRVMSVIVSSKPHSGAR